MKKKNLNSNSPNIILIILDSLRADKVFSKENGIYLTPFLKKILDHSYYFKNCISNNTWTLPSHNSIFSGLYATQIRKISKELHSIINKIPLLAEILNQSGYYTLCYTENPWISKIFRNIRGFDSYINNIRYSFYNFEKNRVKYYFDKLSDIFRLKLKNIITSKRFLKFFDLFKNYMSNLIQWFFEKFFWKKWVFDYRNTLKILEQLTFKLKERIENKPFYLFFNVMATHYPYIPPKFILNKFGINNKQIKNIKNYLLNPRKFFIDMNIRSLNFSECQITCLKNLYDSCVYYSNLIVKKIISSLEELGLLKNSYVFITSDHGEHLCSENDHYLWGHGIPYSAYDELIKVPLIIYNPKFKKRVIVDQVELKDIFHTVLHLAGVENNNFFNLKKSILYQINNNSTPKYVFGEDIRNKKHMKEIIKENISFLDKDLVLKIYYDLYYIRSQNYKYISFENKIEEFYNLKKDPIEKNNIINNNDEIGKKMKFLMKKILSKIKNINMITNKFTKQEKELINKSIFKIKKNI
jgi:arylsulfatase A-like enzyme